MLHSLVQKRDWSEACEQQQLQQQIQRGQSSAVPRRLTLGKAVLCQPAQRSAISVDPMICTGRGVTSVGQALQYQ